MGKIFIRFQTETAQKQSLWGGTNLYGLCKGATPPGLLSQSRPINDIQWNLNAFDQLWQPKGWKLNPNTQFITFQQYRKKEDGFPKLPHNFHTRELRSVEIKSIKAIMCGGFQPVNINHLSFKWINTIYAKFQYGSTIYICRNTNRW